MIAGKSRRLTAGAAVTFAAVWLVRWLTVSFTNDHFVHLSRARQILEGEWPVRDFVDPGLLLHYLASAGMLALSGNTLFGEALLTVTAVALGAALCFYLAGRFTGSVLLATAAAVVAAATFPRLYNYPKVLLYPVALLCAWRYIERPSIQRLLTLALVTVVAFLFRHDHGVYIGIVGVVAVVLSHLRSPRAAAFALTGFAAAGVVLILPFLIYLEAAGGIMNYVRQLPSVDSVTTPRVVMLPFTIDRGEPLLSVAPPSAGHIQVRWRQEIDETHRLELERRYQLRDRVQQTGGWRYDLDEDGSAARLGALLRDPAVLDVAGVDRTTLQPVVGYPLLRSLRNRVALFRVRIAPSLFSEDNALAWLYYVTFALPFAAAPLVFVSWRRRRLTDAEAASAATLLVMCLVTNQGLIRESPDSRLADVAGSAAILAAVVTSLTLKTRFRRVVAGVACVLWSATIVGAAIHGRALQELAATRLLGGPTALRDQWSQVTQHLHQRPIDWYAPPHAEGLGALTRYIFDCTSPSDRVLVTWFAPELPFLAERRFAGGDAFIDPGGWHSTPAEQELTIARLRAQRVPVILMDSRWEMEVEKRFPMLFSFIHSEYTEAARAPFGDDHDYVVLASRNIPAVRRYTAAEVPCYR